MKYWLTAGLTLLSLFLGLFFFQASNKPGPSENTAPPASNYSIINLSNETLETFIADGTYSRMIEDSDSTVMFRVHSGGPTRISGDLDSKGTLYITNPAGIVMGTNAEPVIRSVEFQSSL